MTRSSSQPNLNLAGAEHAFPVRFWMMVVLSGAGAGVAGGGLMWLLHAVEHLAWNYRTGTMLEAVSRSSAARRVLMLAGAGILVGVGDKLLRKTFGKAGDVNAAIWFRSGRLPMLATLAQAVQSIVIVGMGTSLGRESAIKQAGGAIASRVARWGRLTLAQQRVLVACGVGAGMAAAYNVPLGGALFAVEVLLGTLSLRLALPALVASVIATAASWLLLPTGPIYHVPEFSLSISLVLWAIAAGPACGAAAVWFVRSIGLADRHKPKGWAEVLSPMLVLTALGSVSIAFPQVLGNGKDAVQLAFADEVSLGLLLALPVLKLLATAGCLGSGAHGGLFTPTMTVGALLGGLFGSGWHSFSPGVSIGCCAVIGSCAFLAAATQGPVSAVVLVLELTRHIDATMVPMLLAVCGAMLVARRLETRSVYSIRLPEGKAAATSPPPRGRTRFEHLMSYDYIAVSAADGYPEIAERMLAQTGGEDALFFVVDDEAKLTGQIDRQTAMEAHRVGLPLGAATAADIARPVQPLTSDMDERDVLTRLQPRGTSCMPVVEANSGRLIGSIKRFRAFSETP